MYVGFKFNGGWLKTNDYDIDDHDNVGNDGGNDGECDN